MRLAINRTVAPQLDLEAFLGLARTAGVGAIEVRNDVEGQEFANGVAARELRQRLRDAGLAFASINALQRFNDWTAEREREATALIRYAKELGAPGIVMCPVIATDHGWSDGELERKLRQALRAMAPIYRDHGVIGYVEPLGMVGSTLRHQAPAVAAIADVDGGAAFALCYDTFQFYRSRDQQLFADQIGLVHVSGISRTDLPREQLTEPDRGLIDGNDIVDNLAQLQALKTAGYDGFVSIEPFDPKVQRDSALVASLAASIRYIEAGLHG